jgi:polysaccharide biosynthesis protein PslH
MQKILSLVWFKIYPPYFGGQKGIAFFNKELAKYFEVDCLCSANNDIIEDAGCNILPGLPVKKSQFVDPFSWNRIRRNVNKRNYAYIIVEFPYYGFVGVWLKNKHRRLIIHTHNIESQRFKSFHKKGWKLLHYYERWSLRKADCVIFKTGEDKAYALVNFGLEENRCYVLPYGIEKKPIDKTAARKILEERCNITGNEKLLLFAGTLDYEPNRHAVELIISRLLPLLKNQLADFRIIICGNDVTGKLSAISKLNDPEVLFTGFVEDIETYFSAADVFINPVENVHGIQTKIMDALSFDLNVVCFEDAAEILPEYLSDSKVFAAPANNYEAFTAQVLKALTLNFATPERFFLEFSWQNLVKYFVAYLEDFHKTSK